MKFEKSKPLADQTDEQPAKKIFSFMTKRQQHDEKLSSQKLRLLEENRRKARVLRWQRVRKGIGQFFTVLFVVAVIFSMIVVPLLIVFG